MMTMERIASTFTGPGVDQHGTVIGDHRPGDVAQIHLKASYVVIRPAFQIGRFSFGTSKERETEFVSTHMIGDTAFIDVPIQDKPKGNNRCLTVLSECIQTMKLGDGAKFRIPINHGNDNVDDLKFQSSFTEQPPLKGTYKQLPPMDGSGGVTVIAIQFDIDSFRIIRNSVVHVRPNRNGTGGKMPGSFGMGA